MTEFDVLRQALAEYKIVNKDAFNNIDNDIVINTNVCTHEDIINERGMSICSSCGEEIDQKLVFDKEYRYNAPSEMKNVIDPNIVHMQNQDQKGIFSDVEGLGFPDKIIREANRLYLKVSENKDVGTKIFRGNTRRSIVCACIFYAYKNLNMPMSHTNLVGIFQITNKAGLNGLKTVKLSISDKSIIQNTYITPFDLIEEIMNKFSATKEQKDEAKVIYSKIQNRSSDLNRSRPLSVAAGLVYYWNLLKGRKIPLKDYAEKVGLSELTITKVNKQINIILAKSKQQSTT